MKYTKEEMEHMLEYAKKWYPVGTKFRYINSVSSNSSSYGVILDNREIRWEKCSNPKEIYANNGHGRLFGHYMGEIYKWAEIIDGPQPPAYNPLEKVINYEIY